MIRDAKVLEAYVCDLLDSMPDASFMVNSAGSIVLANDLAAKMFGYESQELRGTSIGALVPERFRHLHEGHCLDYFTRPRTRAMGAGLTLRALRKDGAEFPVEISLSPIETDQGTFVFGTIRDISQSEERYRAIFEQVAVGVVYSNSERRVLNVNPKFCEISGYTREEALALDIDKLTHPDDIGKSNEARARVLAGTSPAFDTEARLIRKDRTGIWAHITTSLVRGANGRPVHFISLIHDISPQKRAEDERRESERRFTTMLQNVDLVAMMLDRDARVTYCNDYLLRLTGWTREEVTGQNWFEQFLAPENRVELKGVYATLLADLPDAFHYENDILTRSRERRRIRWNNSILRSSSGDVVGTASIGEDITELRRAEAEIEHTVATLRRAVQGTIEVVSTIGALRDPYTHGHERRVGEVATAIATEIGLPAERIEGIRVIGYLHDVGKIAVPAEILSKPTRLLAAEFELVMQHAERSYEILKDVEFPWPVAEAVWQHHERLDGSGYPRRLKGEQIILEARILAVADTVEAMASHRPYRPSLGIEAALAEIENNRGKLYDPTVVDACLRLFRVKGYRLPA